MSDEAADAAQSGKAPVGRVLRIGTRGSPLARWQSEWVAGRLRILHPGLVVELAQRLRGQTGLNVVVLSGGVFQNPLLLSATRRTLLEGDFTVLCPRLLPPNDGGIALGQVLAAASRVLSGG